MADQFKPEHEGAEDRTLEITHLFNAPRLRVWQAWTEPELFMRWWGPREYTCPVSKIDLRVGGSYLACMRSPAGEEMWSGGEFREINAPQRLVFTDAFMDAEGKIISPAQYGIDDWPEVLLVTLTFTEPEPGRTLLTLEHEGMPPGVHRDLTGDGWKVSFEKLAESLQE